MSTCTFRSSCVLYKDLELIMPITLESIKTEYCDSNYSRCARYKIHESQGQCSVPRSLFPGDIEKASSIISKSH